ncbi:MAG: helix-turn-helix domain-containing protein [Phycisphaerae bacterium]
MKTKSITETLKHAIRGSNLTVYRIAKDTGLQQSAIHRFLSGETSLRLDCADKIAAYLGLSLRKD